MAGSTDIPYRYATAWLDAADERGVLPRVRAEIDGFEALLNASAEFAAFLEDSLIPPHVKQEALTTLFRGKVSEITLNFLLLITDRQRGRLFADMLKACHALLDERDGIAHVEVTSAVALTDAQQGGLQTKLETLSGKRIRMHTRVDPSLVAGFVVQMGDTVFDGSLAIQLQRIRQALTGR